MQLPAIRKKLSTISTRKKLLFMFLGVSILFLFLITIELLYCLRDIKCSLILDRKTKGMLGLEIKKRKDIGTNNTNVPNSIIVEIIRVDKDQFSVREFHLEKEGEEEEYQLSFAEIGKMAVPLFFDCHDGTSECLSGGAMFLEIPAKVQDFKVGNYIVFEEGEL